MWQMLPAAGTAAEEKRMLISSKHSNGDVNYHVILC